MSKKNSLDRQQHAYTLVLLEDLTVTELMWWQLILRGDID